ncbi:MAG TPA: alpha/beta-type small acid-soluble spore protein [Limnochordales bacterium]|nr:alpha/beta-type small acid-soluble spore protein [Limnochordales bacterium]
MAVGQKRNRALVPQARQALEQLKNEVSSEIASGPDPQAQALQSWYQSGYGGEVPSRVWGAVGGNMVRRMIAAAEQSLIQGAALETQAAFRQALGQAFPGAQQAAQAHQAPQAQQFQHQGAQPQQLSTNPFQVQIPHEQ